ncbi:hypothetical protein OUZ56_021700 [Daphnia magna]|uniref:Uncharacterized protein n=1 Tax=Daphnia magna TaxID=35525 RepID=A0ABR0AU87_9CRUS|nr:hypothetical protein OUZ56_021700 [Daphnia magna]
MDSPTQEISISILALDEGYRNRPRPHNKIWKEIPFNHARQPKYRFVCKAPSAVQTLLPHATSSCLDQLRNPARSTRIRIL